MKKVSRPTQQKEDGTTHFFFPTLKQQLSCALHSTHVVHMAGALAGCRTALVSTGWLTLLAQMSAETTLSFWSIWSQFAWHVHTTLGSHSAMKSTV